MTNDNYDTDELVKREAYLTRELNRRVRGITSDTEVQILAARGHRGIPVEPESLPESQWSASHWQAFHARGVRPLKGNGLDGD